MKKNKLDSISYVDDRLVEKADKYTVSKKKNTWMKWGALAACLCLVVFAAAVFPKYIHEQGAGKPAPGCSQQQGQTDNTTSMHENDSASNQLVQDEQPSEEVEMLTCVLHSIDEMVSHIKEISGKRSTDPIERSVKLESLTYFYAPTASVFPGYQLFQIEVLPDHIIYYFTPIGEKEEGFHYDSGITVTYCRYDDITLSSLSTQLGVNITDNEFLYDSKRGDISFMAETSVITIHVPKSLNDYPNLKSVCSVEKIIVE